MKTGKNVLMKGLSLLIVLLMLMSLGGAALADEEPALQPENTAVSQDDSAEAENSSEPEAAAEAEANQKIARSLTPELIEKIKYERWNGQLPTVSGGSSIVNVGDVMD